jgi:hypothetical protein
MRWPISAMETNVAIAIAVVIVIVLVIAAVVFVKYLIDW